VWTEDVTVTGGNGNGSLGIWIRSAKGTVTTDPACTITGADKGTVV